MPGINLQELRRMNGIVVPMPEERDWATMPDSYNPTEIPHSYDRPEALFDAMRSPDRIYDDVQRRSLGRMVIPKNFAGLPRNPRGATNTVGGFLWHRVNPSVTPIVIHGNDVLLVQLNATGLWAPPGGFLEADEDIRSAAFREIKEEAGVKCSQQIPYQLIAQDFADHPWDTDDRWVEDRAVFIDTTGLAKQALHPTHCGKETSDARWLPLRAVPLDQMSFYHAGIIAKIREQLEQRTLTIV